MNGREISIDILKGIAIILVVVGHNTNQDIKDMIFCFHMPLFFVLSGYLFSPKPINKYLYRSTSRLLLPYISFLIAISVPEMLNLIHNDNVMGGV